MAKARMLHNKISKSLEVERLPLPAQLLYTWMIAHADDDGRLKGEPKYIKATVVPYKNWSQKRIADYLISMKNLSLIYYWETNNEWFIEFPKWKEFQYIQKDRYHISNLPSFNKNSVTTLDTERIQAVNEVDTQYNISEENKIEENKSETNISNFADNDIYTTDPNTYPLKSNEESEAKNAWTKLEPNNPLSFYTTYLEACRKGLPAHLFGQFTSEIKQDPSIKNPGAVFNKKVDDYFEKQK